MDSTVGEALRARRRADMEDQDSKVEDDAQGKSLEELSPWSTELHNMLLQQYFQYVKGDVKKMFPSPLA